MQQIHVVQNVLVNEIPLKDVTLNLLPDTSTLDPETELDALPQPDVGALGPRGEQLLDAVVSRQLDELRLPPQRVDGVLPEARHRVLCRLEGVGRRLLVSRLRRRSLRLGGRGGEDRGRRVARQEDLQSRWQRLGQPDVRRGAAGCHGSGRDAGFCLLLLSLSSSSWSITPPLLSCLRLRIPGNVKS